MTTENPTCITPELMSVMDELDLISRHVVEGFLSGTHRSPFLGYSSEFSSYRPYIQGDNIRHVDWKVWARTDQYYLKQFEDDTNMHCRLFVDCSESMNIGRVNKFQFAKILAGALSYLMVRQNDAPGITLFGQSVYESMPSRGGRHHLENLLLFLVRAHAHGRTAFSHDLEQVVDTWQKRGMSIIISDLFVSRDEIVRFLNYIAYRSQEVIVFHVLAEEEVNFDFDGEYIFEDAESGVEKRTHASRIRKEYLKRFKDHCEKIQDECRALEVDYSKIQTHQPLDGALTKYFEWRSATRV